MKGQQASGMYFMAFGIQECDLTRPQSVFRPAAATAQRSSLDPVCFTCGASSQSLISIIHGRALRTAVAIWLPVSREVYSLAGLPEGGRRKVTKAETQTNAFCYLVAALVNDGNRGEENRSCRVSTALWTISRKSCWLACSRAGSGFHTRASSLSPEKMWQNL